MAVEPKKVTANEAMALKLEKEMNLMTEKMDNFKARFAQKAIVQEEKAHCSKTENASSQDLELVSSVFKLKEFEEMRMAMSNFESFCQQLDRPSEAIDVISKNVKLEDNDADIAAADPDVDVLKPMELRDFVEFDTYFDYFLQKPDYKFEIKNFSKLIQQEIELQGQEFRFPRFDFSIQIKCHVKFDQFVLSMAFLDPKKHGKAVEARLDTKYLAVFKRKELSTGQYHDTLLTGYCKFDHPRFYGRFYAFYTFSYAMDIKNDIGLDENSLLVHLHVKNCYFPTDLFIADEVLLWKINVRGFQHVLEQTLISKEKEFALTPFLYSQSDEYVMQIRLSAYDEQCEVEVRYLKKKITDDGFPSFILKVIHPTDSSRKMIVPVKPQGDKFAMPNYAPVRSSYKFLFATLDELIPFIFDGELLVRVEMYARIKNRYNLFLRI